MAVVRFVCSVARVMPSVCPIHLSLLISGSERRVRSLSLPLPCLCVCGGRG